MNLSLQFVDPMKAPGDVHRQRQSVVKSIAFVHVQKRPLRATCNARAGAMPALRAHISATGKRLAYRCHAGGVAAGRRRPPSLRQG